MSNSTKALLAGAAIADLPFGEARVARKRAVADVRRPLVLTVAPAALFELGLEGASRREMAKRAGYTPGAIYSYVAKASALAKTRGAQR